MKDHCILVFGSYINSYCIVRELHEKGVREIVVFDLQKRCTAYSNKIRKYVRINRTNLLSEIMKLRKGYMYIVVFPIDELHIEMLLEIRDSIKHFCFLPFNERSIASKYDQYLWSKTLKVPCPRTILLYEPSDYKEVLEMLPVIIKPNIGHDVRIKNIRLYSLFDYKTNQKQIEEHLSRGFKFIASDIIPGDGTVLQCGSSPGCAS